MAGQIPLDTKYYPNDFATVTFPIYQAMASSCVMLYADRNLIIDSVIVTINDGPDSTTNLRVAYVTDNASPTYVSGNSTGTTFNVTTAIAMTGGSPVSGGPSNRYISGVTSGFDLVKSNGVPVNNLVPAGSTIWWVASISLTGVERGSIQIRYRSQL